MEPFGIGNQQPVPERIEHQQRQERFSEIASLLMHTIEVQLPRLREGFIETFGSNPTNPKSDFETDEPGSRIGSPIFSRCSV